jgi:hypothetical protein
MTDPATATPPQPDTADRLKDRTEAFGREAQAAGERWARDPQVVSAGTSFTRFFGLVLIVLGLWLFGRFTLDLDLPAVNWDLVWPLGLIALGGFVLLSAATRRR